VNIIYHPEFLNSNYSQDPAAEKGRILSILEELKKEDSFNFIEPETARRKDLNLIHPPEYIDKIYRRNKLLYQIAALAAGASLKAAEMAWKGESSFALIRPPGHHASPSSSWGFCFFNNMGIAIENLFKKNKINSAFILDFDLHIGDGNINSLKSNSQVSIFNPKARNRKKYLKEVKDTFKDAGEHDILGVSAGFDEHIKDWGGKLTTEDYKDLGILCRDFSDRKCKGRVFALLEGGYNHQVLGQNVRAFLKGLQKDNT